MKKVLICDDDEGILNVMKIVLEEDGYNVLLSNSAKGIQKKIEKFSPDVLLIDLWMPGIAGEEVVKVLKRDQNMRNLPIIVISALNRAEKIAQDIGADGFLEKPFNISDLTGILKKFNS